MDSLKSVAPIDDPSKTQFINRDDTVVAPAKEANFVKLLVQSKRGQRRKNNNLMGNSAVG